MLWTWRHPNWKVECGQQKEDADQMHMSERVLGLSWCTVMNCQEKPVLDRYVIVGGQSDNPCQWIYTNDMNGLLPPRQPYCCNSSKSQPFRWYSPQRFWVWSLQRKLGKVVTKIKSEMSQRQIGYSTWDMGQDKNPTTVHGFKSDVIDTRNDKRAPPIQARPRSSPGHSLQIIPHLHPYCSKGIVNTRTVLLYIFRVWMISRFDQCQWGRNVGWEAR